MTKDTESVRRLISDLRRDLEELARIPLVSVPGQIDEPLPEAHEAVARLFSEAGTPMPCALRRGSLISLYQAQRDLQTAGLLAWTLPTCQRRRPP